MIEDEVQSYHWTQESCTLHPAVLYHRTQGKLVEECLCMISDDLKHDTSFVHEVMDVIINFIKMNINGSINNVQNFSDGCAGQYKTLRIFFNIGLHKKDFVVKCSWTFFATSHGKSPCDGVGGTIKRLVTNASLPRPGNQQILTAVDVFYFCQEKITGIKVFFLEKDPTDLKRISFGEKI